MREIATLSRLRLSDEEVANLTQDLDSILGYVAELSALDIAAVEPMTHAVPFDCPLRPDEVRPSLPLEEALANAPAPRGELLPGAPHRPRPAGGGGEEDL